MAIYARWPNTATYINMVLASTVFLQCTVCHEQEELPATVTMAVFGAPRLPGF